MSMKKFSELASKEQINKAIAALQANGVEAELVDTGADAKRRVLELIPEGAEVMNQTSVTLDTIGLPQEINNSGRYNSIRNKLNQTDGSTQRSEKQKLGAGPDWTVGSVHAVTEDGKVLVASNTGSQLSSYAGGAQNVVWVVGAQKLVTNQEEAIKRIYEYVLPLEDARAQKAYGVGSNVSKLLIINKEVNPGRIHLIFVNEVLGF